MKKYSLKLSFQCSEDWNKMIPNETGKHCLNCNKTVIDFSIMKDEEIVKYLLANKNTCGRFNPTQLGRPMVVFNRHRKSNWPAIAAMLIAGLVSIAPSGLHAAIKNVPTYNYRSTTGEKENNKVEPDTAGNYNFTIRLFNTETKERIFYGYANILQLGIFYADAKGDIVITVNEKDIPDHLIITIGTNGYGDQQFLLNKKDLKNSVSADLYITAVQMPAGVVAIDEHYNPTK